jgi:hypothetical protein
MFRAPSDEMSTERIRSFIAMVAGLSNSALAAAHGSGAGPSRPKRSAESRSASGSVATSLNVRHPCNRSRMNQTSRSREAGERAAQVRNPARKS